jgi:hypothetical protein
VRPSQLPKTRDQVLRHLDDPTASLRASTSEDAQPWLDHEASRLRAAELYWVTPDMAALAMGAGQQLAAARWATADRPAPCGLIMFDGGIGSVDSSGVDIPVEAVSWGPQDGGLGVGLWMSRALLAERIAHFATLPEDSVPPLLPVGFHVLPVGVEPESFAALGDGPIPIFQALAASWLLMQQPTLVDRRLERPDKATARACGRLGRPVLPVSVIDLRRAYVPDTREDTGQEVGGRHYRHRWVVQGHWRDQPHGPERSLRRKQWIPAHIKGPDGAPLLMTERVNVWRR